ncbi:Inhibitor of growth protein 5 [Geodia barretti]|uniref:Inhibitor of growth protein 5 n=1 Tax=Geodia barretti TaxID=519541 RepID=A0AA35XEI8_GEOBA|nr:Inhibitor of growth protein 5 [Geodia barretti]
MASALYLENFLENIENLPTELQRNFTLMRSLDQRAQDLLKEIDVNSADYKAKVKDLSKEERKERLTKIQETFQKAREYSDDKVQIAMQMYEMVDKHIRRLDSDLSRFEQELKMKEPGMRRTSISSIAEMAPPSLHNKGRKRSTIIETAGGSRKKKLASTSEEPR